MNRQELDQPSADAQPKLQPWLDTVLGEEPRKGERIEHGTRLGSLAELLAPSKGKTLHLVARKGAHMIVRAPVGQGLTNSLLAADLLKGDHIRADRSAQNGGDLPRAPGVSLVGCWDGPEVGLEHIAGREQREIPKDIGISALLELPTRRSAGRRLPLAGGGVAGKGRSAAGDPGLRFRLGEVPSEVPGGDPQIESQGRGTNANETGEEQRASHANLHKGSIICPRCHASKTIRAWRSLFLS